MFKRKVITREMKVKLCPQGYRVTGRTIVFGNTKYSPDEVVSISALKRALSITKFTDNIVAIPGELLPMSSELEVHKIAIYDVEQSLIQYPAATSLEVVDNSEPTSDDVIAPIPSASDIVAPTRGRIGRPPKYNSVPDEVKE